MPDDDRVLDFTVQLLESNIYIWYIVLIHWFRILDIFGIHYESFLSSWAIKSNIRSRRSENKTLG